MFSQFVGNYFIENGIINREEFITLMKYQNEHRVKLGTIAIAEGLLTQKQADEINNIQASKDMRFGDIAVSKGYLSDEDIDNLLRQQGSPYLIFLQGLEELGIMNQDTFSMHISDFQRTMHMTNSDLNALKNSDIDSLISFFAKNIDSTNLSVLSIVLKNITRFVTPHYYIRPAECVSEYSAKYMCAQKLNGDISGFIMLASNTYSLLPVACGFGKWDFKDMDEDSIDSICEFINCSSGLFASAQSIHDIEIELLPPESYIDSSIKSAHTDIIVLPIFIDRQQIDIVISTTSIPDIIK